MQHSFFSAIPKIIIVIYIIFFSAYAITSQPLSATQQCCYSYVHKPIALLWVYDHHILASRQVVTTLLPLCLLFVSIAIDITLFTLHFLHTTFYSAYILFTSTMIFQHSCFTCSYDGLNFIQIIAYSCIHCS